VVAKREISWAWKGGNFYGDRLGLYGERGIPSTTNVPGARSNAVGWYDSINQELWLFGGEGYTKSHFGNFRFAFFLPSRIPLSALTSND